MSGRIAVWTKQHANILQILEAHSRYVVKKEYIVQKMEEHASLYLDVYDWYLRKAGELSPPPDDVRYPIWVSLSEEEKIENSQGNVQLEIIVERERLLTLDLGKWGRIVNYMYIPENEADDADHERILTRYGIDDCTAYMTSFYPSIKHKIIKSWDRLFDDNIRLSDARVGTLWELKQEWIVKVIR